MAIVPAEIVLRVRREDKVFRSSHCRLAVADSADEVIVWDIEDGKNRGPVPRAELEMVVGDWFNNKGYLKPLIHPLLQALVFDTDFLTDRELEHPLNLLWLQHLWPKYYCEMPKQNDRVYANVLSNQSESLELGYYHEGKRVYISANHFGPHFEIPEDFRNYPIRTRPLGRRIDLTA